MITGVAAVERRNVSSMLLEFCCPGRFQAMPMSSHTPEAVVTSKSGVQRRNAEVISAVALVLVLAVIGGVLLRARILDDKLDRVTDMRNLRAAEALLAAGARPRVRTRNGRNLMVVAAGANNTSVLVSLLDRGMNPNLNDVNQVSPLWMAANRGSIAAIDLLLRRGADIDQRSLLREDALMSAAVAGQAEAVKLLLSRGASASRDHSRALALAAIKGDPTTVQVLIEHHADVNARDEEGKTILRQARNSAFRTAHERAEVIQLLLRSGAHD